MKKRYLILTMMTCLSAFAQNVMTPERLWELQRLSALGISKDGKQVIYKVSIPDVKENKFNSRYYAVPVNGGPASEVSDYKSLLADKNLSPDGKHTIYHEEVKINKVHGSDFYADLPKSNVQIYDGLDYRHWDTWNEGKHNHVFYKQNGVTAAGVDIMSGEPFDAPQKPFGGDEDYIWSPDGKRILYVAKKLAGTAYAASTNTDIYEYTIATGKTVNLTAANPGYDTAPQFGPAGQLSWLQMKCDGYEADKNDIIVMLNDRPHNLTSSWNGTVDSFVWSADGKKIYFTAAVDGSVQLFEIVVPSGNSQLANVKQLTKGTFDITGIVGFSEMNVIVTRTDMNHAPEIYSYSLKSGVWKKLTSVNDEIYNNIGLSKLEKKYVTTTDGKQMLVWIIFPPDFDPAKKYPTLLYCQGGPQSALSQFYSYRWNFQLMAAQGYIVVAPNRRGMPGHGVEWNEQISKDWGGQVMRDYLSAIDDVATRPYVDKDRLG